MTPAAFEPANRRAVAHVWHILAGDPRRCLLPLVLLLVLLFVSGAREAYADEAECRQAARTAFQRGNHHHRAARWADVEQAWLSTYAWARGSVPTRHLVEILDYRQQGIAATAIACELSDRGMPVSAEPAIAAAQQVVQDRCRRARERQPHTTELYVPAVPPCDANPVWAIEIVVAGNVLQAQRFDQLPALPAGATLEVHLRRIDSAPREAFEPSPAPSAAPSEGPVAPASVDVDIGLCQGARLLPCLLGGAGAAVALTAIVPTYQLLHSRQRVRDLCSNGSCGSEADLARAQTWSQQARQHATVANLLWASGAVMLAGSLGWYWLGAADTASTPPFSALCTRSGCGLSGQLEF
jgi:hypothetical protein